MELTIQLTPQGLLIDHPLIREWLTQGIEIVPQKDEQVLIRPRLIELTERQRIRQLLITSGLRLVDLSHLPPDNSISKTMRNELAHKFSVGQPLTEILLEERAEAW